MKNLSQTKKPAKKIPIRTSTLTLRLNSEETNELEAVKELLREKRSSFAIMELIRRFPESVKRDAENTETIFQLNKEMYLNQEKLGNLKRALTAIGLSDNNSKK